MVTNIQEGKEDVLTEYYYAGCLVNPYKAFPTEQYHLLPRRVEQMQLANGIA